MRKIIIFLIFIIVFIYNFYVAPLADAALIDGVGIKKYCIKFDNLDNFSRYDFYIQDLNAMSPSILKLRNYQCVPSQRSAGGERSYNGYWNAFALYAIKKDDAINIKNIDVDYIKNNKELFSYRDGLFPVVEDRKKIYDNIETVVNIKKISKGEIFFKAKTYEIDQDGSRKKIGSQNIQNIDAIILFLYLLVFIGAGIFLSPKYFFKNIFKEKILKNKIKQ